MNKYLNFNIIKKIIFYLVLLFILDLSGLINLYGENFVRRIINMFRRRDELSYEKKLKPYCQKYFKMLDKNEVKKLQSIKIPDTKDISWFSRTNTTTHKCCEKYSEQEVNIIKEINEKVRQRYQEIIGIELYDIKSSDPTIYVYNGKDSKHLWHVDPKNVNTIYNIIICIDKKGNISPLQCKDKDGNINSIHFEPGDAALFNGGTTVHQVPPNDDPNSKRTVLSLAFTSDKEFSEKMDGGNSLCSFIEAGNNKFNIFGLIFAIFFINYIISKLTDIDKVNFKYIFPILVISLLIAKYIPLYFDINLGTGRSSSIFKNLQLLIIFMGITLSPNRGSIFFIYYLLSDVFFPRKWVEYD